mmetsp:Transcript_9528/g.21830  ORF Transcript_9528/g.21830 Transcript_9528/m.21830 type:complete len:91 (-) Transcript_9528:585-857(-)
MEPIEDIQSYGEQYEADSTLVFVVSLRMLSLQLPDARQEDVDAGPKKDAAKHPPRIKKLGLHQGVAVSDEEEERRQHYLAEPEEDLRKHL